MGEDSLMVSPTRGDGDDDDLQIPKCESPIPMTPTTAATTAPWTTDSQPAPAPAPKNNRPPDQPGPSITEKQQQSASAAPSPPPPRVTTVVPALFVPIDADWSLPLNQVDLSTSEHAHVMLGTLDYYRTGVRQGILHLASLDRQRIMLAQAEAEREERTRRTTSSSAPPAPDDDYIPPAEIDDMIAAMCAPAVAGADYNITTEAMMQALPIQFPSPLVGERPGGRRDHIRQLNEVAEQAIVQLGGFDMHMGQQRARWTAVIEREAAAAAAAASAALAQSQQQQQQLLLRPGDQFSDKAQSTPPPPPPPPPPPLHEKDDTAMSGV